MPEDEVAVVARGLAERYEVAFFKLQLRVEMKWMAVMNLQLDLAAADCARRKLLEMRLTDGRPVRRARSAKRMLAFRSIDEMFDDGHGRKQKKPH